MRAPEIIVLTGGTGSFGRRFVEKTILKWPDAVIRVYSRDELKQSEMRAAFGDRSVRYFIGDVRDRDRLYRAANGADVIVHAAAMKQVPACEYNPFEAVQTNIFGTQNVIEVAIDAGVERVVFLSTDKAVNPVNLYGATKLCAEKLIVQGNSYVGSAPTRLLCVRYGNVLGSRGSVVPLFRDQALTAGRITITDERMTRFFLTLDESVELVHYALATGAGGEVFIPKIPSVRIGDLAEAVAPGVPRDIIGIRPGEKLHEVLITADESHHTVDLGDVYAVVPELPFWDSDLLALGEPLRGEFVLSSDTNERWLDARALAALV